MFMGQYKLYDSFWLRGSAPIIRPSARKLNNKNPNIRDNFIAIQRTNAEKGALLEQIITLENSIEGTLTMTQIKEYKKIDQIRRHHLH
jgi:hypothetical protein